MGRIIGALGLALLLALGLGGCSMVRLGYSQAPDLAYWWIDSYLDLNEAQSLRLREDLSGLQAWHRRTELPQLATLLVRVQGLAAADTTPAQVCALGDDVRQRLVAVSDRMEPTVLAIAPTLGAEQMAHLQRQFDKRNQSWKDDWLDGTPAELLERRLRRTVERAEMFYGRLDDRQRALLRQRLAASPFDPQASLRETLRRQQDALQTLRTLQREGAAGPVGEARVRALMRGLFDRSVEPPDAAARAYQQRMLTEGCETLALLHNSTTREQRERAARTLRGYEQDLRTLARAGSG